MTMKSTATDKPCTKVQAKALTERIREGVDKVWSLLLEAHDRKAWKALSYDSWDAYIAGEFNMSRRHSYRLLDQGRVIREIADATGGAVTHGSQITERDAREIKDELPAVSAEIRARVAAGEEPGKATAKVVAAKRVERDLAELGRKTKQAENDAHQEHIRAALPDDIKRGEQAKARNGSPHAAMVGKRSVTHGVEEAVLAERDELLEENAALKADIVERDRRLAMFDDMAVQLERGGFDAVVATKDEQIRVLRRQVEDESADKATWSRRAEFWKKQAFALGYVSPNSQPEIDATGGADITDLAPF
jgi:hypothetical protein